MQHVPRSDLRPYWRIATVFLAVVVSGIDGLLSLGGTFIFSDHEPARLWVAVFLPAFGWIAALASIRYPRSGLAAYFTIAAMTSVLTFTPWEVPQYGFNVGAMLQRSSLEIVVTVLLALNWAVGADLYRSEVARIADRGGERS